MKKPSAVLIGLKTLILFAAFAGVLFLIGNLKKPTEKRTASQVGDDSFLSVLFADDRRPFNWCPRDVRRVEVEGRKPEEMSNSIQIQSFCQILTESFDNSALDMGSFHPILKAFAASGKEYVIEADSTGKIFRFQGLPFGSRDLSQQLDRKKPSH